MTNFEEPRLLERVSALDQLLVARVVRIVIVEVV